ncbi:unnamed protein product [Amoebophrya sp. A120]|nr:unnamed protein product [Amoebophrya sp. A120]|eukprot:GSA120T00015687001.1
MKKRDNAVATGSRPSGFGVLSAHLFVGFGVMSPAHHYYTDRGRMSYSSYPDELLDSPDHLRTRSYSPRRTSNADRAAGEHLLRSEGLNLATGVMQATGMGFRAVAGEVARTQNITEGAVTNLEQRLLAMEQTNLNLAARNAELERLLAGGTAFAGPTVAGTASAPGPSFAYTGMDTNGTAADTQMVAAGAEVTSAGGHSFQSVASPQQQPAVGGSRLAAGAAPSSPLREKIHQDIGKGVQFSLSKRSTVATEWRSIEWITNRAGVTSRRTFWQALSGLLCGLGLEMWSGIDEDHAATTGVEAQACVDLLLQRINKKFNINLARGAQDLDYLCASLLERVGGRWVENHAAVYYVTERIRNLVNSASKRKTIHWSLQDSKNSAGETHRFFRMMATWSGQKACDWLSHHTSDTTTFGDYLDALDDYARKRLEEPKTVGEQDDAADKFTRFLASGESNRDAVYAFTGTGAGDDSRNTSVNRDPNAMIPLCGWCGKEHSNPEKCSFGPAYEFGTSAEAQKAITERKMSIVQDKAFLRKKMLEVSAAGAGSNSTVGKFGRKPGDWDCSVCGLVNFKSRKSCLRCEQKAGRATGGGGKGAGKTGYNLSGPAIPSGNANQADPTHSGVPTGGAQLQLQQQVMPQCGDTAFGNQQHGFPMQLAGYAQLQMPTGQTNLQGNSQFGGVVPAAIGPRGNTAMPGYNSLATGGMMQAAGPSVPPSLARQVAQQQPVMPPTNSLIHPSMQTVRPTMQNQQPGFHYIGPAVSTARDRSTVAGR